LSSLGIPHGTLAAMDMLPVLTYPLKMEHN
jgi:hypothetical protein